MVAIVQSKHPKVIHPKELLKKDRTFIEKFNTKVALLVTKWVGTMLCAYLFCLLALSGLHAALRPGGIGFSNWFAEEFIQLVLLSIIMVGQNVAQASSNAKVDADHQNLVVLMELQEEQMKELKLQTDLLKFLKGSK